MVDRTRPLLLRIRRSTCAAVFGAVLVAGTTATLALASTALPENVRSTDSQIVDLLREGARRSATFRYFAVNTCRVA